MNKCQCPGGKNDNTALKAVRILIDAGIDDVLGEIKIYVHSEYVNFVQFV